MTRRMARIEDPTDRECVTSALLHELHWIALDVAGIDDCEAREAEIQKITDIHDLLVALVQGRDSEYPSDCVLAGVLPTLVDGLRRYIERAADEPKNDAWCSLIEDQAQAVSILGRVCMPTFADDVE